MTDHPILKAVVFDLDGLMFNTEELYEEVGAQLLARRGKKPSPELLDQLMGRPSRMALQFMIQWLDLDASVAQLEAESEALFPALLDARLAPMPGLMPLLDCLDHAGIPAGIATGSGRAFAIDVLSRFGLEARFQFLLTAEDVVHGKPDPEIYQTACRLLELPPPQVMVLEDSELGCRAAVAAGTFAVAVPGPHGQRHNFHGTQFVADSLEDLRIYRSLGGASQLFKDSDGDLGSLSGQVKGNPER